MSLAAVEVLAEDVVDWMVRHPELAKGIADTARAIIEGNKSAAIMHAEATAAKQAAKLAIREKRGR
jgi:hypothetical protein